MSPTYDELMDENRVLKARIRDLTTQPTALVFKQAFNMPGNQCGAVLSVLHSRRSASKDVIYSLVFEDETGDGPELKIVDVVICKIRRALLLSGAPGQIETIWGTGYRVDETLRAYLSTLLEPEALAA